MRAALAAGIIAVQVLTAMPAAAGASPADDLARMTLQQLTNVEVTSVSKSPQPLARAPAAIYVITHEDIMRSGAINIPEALRLAPNLQVTRLSASDYVIGARGLGGNQGDQNFSNKLLMLIDGRSVYSPLYSGIYMDAQDVLLDDVERIEVISGPGATLWGANAMNGVINIITRSADQTGGALVRAGAGNLQRNVGARYGAVLGDGLAYRLYGLAFDRSDMQLADRSGAHDGWSKTQGGFRLDWSGGRDLATVQGDIYRAPENVPDSPDGLVSGGNVLGRWQRRLGERSNLQIQAYYDQTERFGPPGGGAFVLHSFDAELQHSVALGAANQLVWGLGQRVNAYAITNTSTLLFQPQARTLTLSDVFAQDAVSLSQTVTLVGGLKFEDDPYSGWSALPDLRLSWNPSATSMLWAAASRAIRAPTPFDADVVEKLGTIVFLNGNPDFAPERLTAYQLGYRSQPARAVSLSVNGFYNVYDDLRSIELSSGPGVLEWGNLMRGDTYGMEAWAQIQLTAWWQLSPGIRTVHEQFGFEPGSTQLLGVAQAGNDPGYQFSLRSAMNVGHKLTVDVAFRYVSPLPAPALPGYYDLTAGIGWHLSDSVQLSVNGSNLLQARHLEYPAPDGEYIARAVIAQARYQY